MSVRSVAYRLLLLLGVIAWVYCVWFLITEAQL